MAASWHEHTVNSDEKPHQFWQHVSTHIYYFRCSIVHTSIEYKTTLKTFSQWIYCYSILLFNFALVSERSPSCAAIQTVGYRACVHFSQFGLYHHEFHNSNNAAVYTWPLRQPSNRTDAFSINVLFIIHFLIYKANEHIEWNEWLCLIRQKCGDALQRNQEKLRQTQ